jgi:hypothetical protein
MTMSKLEVVLTATIGLLLIAGCSMSSETEVDTEEKDTMLLRPLDPDQGENPKTPPPERIAGVLWEAKMQYDDGHYESAFRYAERAATLIVEHDYPEADHALALTIQGYSLHQLGTIEEYYLKPNATVFPGAVGTFTDARRLAPQDYRPILGMGLARFRLHADKVRKAEVLGEGILSLELLAEELTRAAAAKDTQAVKLLESARSNLARFKTNRLKLLGYHYVFKDLSKVKPSERAAEQAPLIALQGPGAGLDEGKESLKLQDVEFTIEDAQAARSLDAGTARAAINDLTAVMASWDKVRQYWRVEALKDLQASRDILLDVRVTAPHYLWVERDLVFVYESLGAYFLDIGLDQARKQAAADGTPVADQANAARRIYLSKDFKSFEKEESRKNYQVALDFTKSFVYRHQREVEDVRMEKSNSADVSEIKDDPFTVDLVVRYRATMDDLISEERDIRYRMILEAAALCIEPLFQVGQVRQAETWATSLKANNPRNPIHHFVLATAYYNDGQFEKARDSYVAFLKESSVAQDKNRRDAARTRQRECEANLMRSGSAGEGSGR